VYKTQLTVSLVSCVH